MPYFRYLDATEAGLSSMIPTIVMIGGMALMFYFFIYKPQKRQERNITAMRNALKVGDEISTNGGILGRIIQIKDEFIVIETGTSKTKLTMARWAVRAVENPAESDDDEEDDEE